MMESNYLNNNLTIDKPNETKGPTNNAKIIVPKPTNPPRYQPINTTVISIHHHKNFKNMLRSHRLKNTLPGINSIKEGVNIYSKFYSDTDVSKYGVLAIKISRKK